MNMAASSCTAAHVLPQQQYDVFLSFRGDDTRLKFTSHLYAALKGKNIHTYMDDKSLERGDEIGPALLAAIEQSKLSIIIFSKHYASSPWCLDELVHILKCNGQLVVPVFYEINPSDVRWQEGTYADALAILEERFKDNMDKVQTWKDALTRAANLSGFHSESQNIRHENELVETIVEDILSKLNRNKLSCSTKGLVGMENHIQQLELLLCISAQDVCFRAAGIWGMGGCGKTTLADLVFHRNSSEFQACVYLANVREESEKQGLYRLRNEFLRKLLKDQNISIDSPSISSYVIDRLSRTKVLAVLDDVSELSQLEILLGDQVKFGPGSRIIITTRNRRLFKKRVHEDHIYKVDLLPDHEALQLFQSIAFEDDSSREGYLDFSEKVVDYAGCNPLALKVLASSFLHCKSKIVWEEELKKLKTFPNKRIQNVLRLCYDGLEENEKGIFLDIACFLKGENRSYTERMLEMHGFSPLAGIEVLIDMSLISITYDGRVEMHDLLQELGKAIEGGIEELGKRKRLWNAKDCFQVLHNKSGTSIVEVMYLDMSKIQELQLSPTAFKNMQNLKLLKIYERPWRVKGKQPSSFSWLPMVKTFQNFLAKSRIWGYLRGLESLPEELKYFYWDRCSFKSLPSKYFPENLVEIHMPCSQVNQLWNNDQNLRSLKHLNLCGSEQLTEVPDLSGSPNIERIDLRWCTRLVEVPSYFQNLEKLTYLDLRYCENLKILGGIPCRIKALHLQLCSRLMQIPPSIWSCEKLHTLDLGSCRFLDNFPSSSNTCKLNVCDGDKKLLSKSFSTESCKLKTWPSSSSTVGRLCSLKELDLSVVASEIPDSLICSPTLEYINLCGTMIESIPTSIKNVSGLRKLDLFDCRKLRSLPELPSQLQQLHVRDCSSLKSVASSRSALMQPWAQYEGPAYGFEEFRFSGCWELDESSRNNILGDAQLRFMRMASYRHVDSLQQVECPGTEIPRWFGYQSEGCEISIKFPGHDLHTTTSEEYPFLGLALSVVVSGLGLDYRFSPLVGFVCDCNFKTNDGEGYHCQFFSGWVWTTGTPKPERGFSLEGDDRVVLWCQGHTEESSNAIPSNKVSEASFRFYPTYPDVKSVERRSLECGQGPGVEVKKCGIHLLYNDNNIDQCFKRLRRSRGMTERASVRRKP